MQPVDEEPYEVGLDNHGCHDGPKTGRLRALDNVSAYFIKKRTVQNCQIWQNIILEFFVINMLRVLGGLILIGNENK